MNISSINSLSPSQLYQNTQDSQNAPQVQRTRQNNSPQTQSRVKISPQARELQQQAATQKQEALKVEKQPDREQTTQVRGTSERNNQIRQAETAAGNAKGHAINLVA